MANLTVIQGDDRGKVYDLRGPRMVLGREPHCDVLLTDHSISRRHAELRVEQGRFRLVDLGSSNGTFVNGTRTDDTVVRPGDQIRLGSELLTLGRVVSGPMLAGSGRVRIDEQGQVVDAAIQATARSELDPAVFIEKDQPSDNGQVRRVMGNLRTLLQFSATVNTILSTDELLERIIDMVFDVVDADRAFVLLLDETTGRMEPRAVRYREDLLEQIEAERSGGEYVDGGEIRTASGDEARKTPIHVSKTIVNYAVEHSEGVLSTNAMQDRRFEEGDSVQDLGIRSAICVPIKSRDRILGVIHVDTQLQHAPFGENDLRMMTALGYQMGLALENTRLVELTLERERLAAVGAAVASLSHYIKNILQGLQGGASVIESGLRDGQLDRIGRGWEIVRRNQRRINNLVLDMLHYSRERQPNLERHSVNAVLREAIELVAPRCTEAQIEIVTHLDPDLPEIWIDPSGIHHACLNILINAVDAVEPRKGRISVVTAVVPSDDPKQRAREDFTITIADNGKGIPDEQLERIFEAFHSTKGHQGTGLGLAVSQKIIAEHGGRIDVDTQPGAGTTFTIRLPIVKPSGAEDTGVPVPARHEHHAE